MCSRTLAVTAVALSVLAPGAGGQIRASERATVSQTVDGTVITVDYSRPRMRGRPKVFGEEVKWEEVWTPGANMATTLEINKPIQVNGHPVPPGRYSVWIQVHQGGEWEFMLDTVADRFHTVRPDPDKVMLRFSLNPETRPSMDVLTWWFPLVRSDRAVLAMQWDTYYVPLEIRVESSYSPAIGSDAARTIVGSYEMRWVPPPPEPADSSHRDSEGPPGDQPTRLEFRYDRGSVFGRVDPPPFPGYDTLVLLRIRDDWYIPAWWKDGELYDASDEMTIEFSVEQGKATGFEMRMKDDTVIARAVRIP
jgi:hypothetical protein